LIFRRPPLLIFVRLGLIWSCRYLYLSLLISSPRAPPPFSETSVSPMASLRASRCAPGSCSSLFSGLRALAPCHVLEMMMGSKEALGWASSHGPSGIATSCAKKGAAATSRASKNHLKKSKLSASRRLLFIFSTTSPLSSPLMYPDPLPSRSL
jgi:hypothetical protein